MNRPARAVTLLAALALALPGEVSAAGSVPQRPPAASDPELPPVAAQHNSAGMAAYRAGDYEAAYRELALAYASMDPKRDLNGRDVVLASLRSALVKLYEKTGELRHLCLARAELLRHLETLVVTFGEDSDLEDIPGTKWRLRQINEKIAKHAPRLDEPACDGRPLHAARPASTSPSRPRPADSIAPPLDRGRPALVVGATTLTVGGILLGAMAYALLMRKASDDGIEALGAAAAMQPDGLHTREQRALADSLLHVGGYHRTTAIATGVSGGALALAGVTALVVRRVRRSKRPAVAIFPAPTRTGGVLVLTSHF